jgi:hypothetical protein
MVGSQPVYGLPRPQIGPGFVIPNMTSDTAPAGYVASASSTFGTSAAWNAMRHPPFQSNGWLTNSGGVPCWLAIQLPRPYVISHYVLAPWWADNQAARAATAWTLEGSNDGTTWTALDYRTGQSWPVYKALYYFAVTWPGAFTRFRIFITSGGATYNGLGCFQLVGSRS